jgi:hypothetical protein
MSTKQLDRGFGPDMSGLHGTVKTMGQVLAPEGQRNWILSSLPNPTEGQR